MTLVALKLFQMHCHELNLRGLLWNQLLSILSRGDGYIRGSETACSGSSSPDLKLIQTAIGYNTAALWLMIVAVAIIHESTS